MFYLGIDAGGTQTTYALGDEQTTLAVVSSGSVKLGSVTEEEARAALAAGVHAVCEQENVGASELRACAVGLSGASLRAIRELVSEELRRLLPGSAIDVYGDHVVAHRAAFPDGAGVLTVAGTGSIAFGRKSAGRELRVGGHGAVISDEGGGVWVGRELLRRLFRARDVGQQHPLLEEIAMRYAEGDADELVMRANSGQIRFSELVPLAVAGAERSNTLCERLLRDAGRELAGLASEVAAGLFGPGEPWRFALSGSVGGNGVVREAFAAEVRQGWPEASLITAALTSAEGALILARRL